MKFSFKHQPSYAMLQLELNPGEKIRSEAGAMIFMSPSITMDTSFGSGILSAIARKFLGGESLFLNDFTAQEAGSTIALASDMVGDISHYPMTGRGIYLQAGSYLCSTPGVQLQTLFGGIRSFFGGEGLFLIKVSGSGDLFFTSYGAIIPIDITSGYVVDTGHIVAFEDSLTFRVKKVGGWKSTLLSGEGFVCEFSGQGRLWIQTRLPDGFIGWITKLLPR